MQNQDKLRIIGCLRPLTMLKEMTLIKSPRTTQLGFNSSTISPNVIGHPSITPANPKTWKHIHSDFIQVKLFTYETRLVWLDVLSLRFAAITLVTWFDDIGIKFGNLHMKSDFMYSDNWFVGWEWVHSIWIVLKCKVRPSLVLAKWILEGSKFHHKLVVIVFSLS